MITTPIRAIDDIIVRRPVSEVWPVLADFEAYPSWWPRSVGIRVLSGGKESLGTEMEIRPSGGRAFRCRVEAIDVPSRLRMRYLGGFVEGIGEWRLTPIGQETRVTYALDARANGRLVFLLGTVCDLGRLHSRSMQSVQRSVDETVRGVPQTTRSGQ